MSEGVGARMDAEISLPYLRMRFTRDEVCSTMAMTFS